MLIAGGLDRSFLKDSHILDIANKTIKVANNLPNEEYFSSPSTTVVANNIYVVGFIFGSIYKFSMKYEKWELIHKFE